MHWPLVLAGLIPVTWSSAILWCGWASQGWPVVSGTLVSHEIRHWRNWSGPHYRPIVTYEYMVGGRRFIGKRRCFQALGDVFVTEQAAYEALAGLVAGADVQVHYLRFLPRIAVLRPGLSTDALIPLLLGMWMVLVIRSYKLG